MMLRGNALPRTPAAATPFSNRHVNSSFIDENNATVTGDFKLGATKTPLTVGKMGGGDHQRRRVALGDISNRKTTTAIQDGSTKKSTTKSTTKKKKQSVVAFSSATKTNLSQKQPNPTKRVNFSSSVPEPSLETAAKPRVLFAAPTPIPKRHLFQKEFLDDDEDDDLDDLFPVEDIERPAGRLWSAEEHGFGSDNDDPRDDISLDEGSRNFMADLRAFLEEASVIELEEEVRRQEEASQHYMEHTFSRIMEEQWKSDLAALEHEPTDFLEERLDFLTLDTFDDDDALCNISIPTPSYFGVCDISF